MRRFVRACFALGLALLPAGPGFAGGPTAADEPATKPGAATPAKDAPGPRLTYGGSVDGYFASNLNNPWNGRNALRLFDYRDEHGPHLNLLDVWVEQARLPVGFRLDLNWGPAARIENAEEPSDDDLWTHIQQLTVSANLDREDRTYVDFGKYVTPVGLEVVEPVDNVLFSQGVLFSSATPYFHLGLRLFHYFNDEDYLLAHVHRGWDAVSSPGHAPGFGLTYNRALSPRWTVTASYLGGDERTDAGAATWRHLVDLIAAYEPDERWLYQFNGTWGSQPAAALRSGGGTRRANWRGVAAIARRKLDQRQSVAARLEWFRDTSGFMLGNDLEVFTLTFNYTHRFDAHLQARVEYRHDVAGGGRPFAGAHRPRLTRDQGTLILALIAGY